MAVVSDFHRCFPILLCFHRHHSAHIHFYKSYFTTKKRKCNKKLTALLKIILRQAAVLSTTSGMSGSAAGLRIAVAAPTVVFSKSLTGILTGTYTDFWASFRFLSVFNRNKCGRARRDSRHSKQMFRSRSSFLVLVAVSPLVPAVENLQGVLPTRRLHKVKETPQKWCLFYLAMDYKKDIFAVFAYEFELSQ